MEPIMHSDPAISSPSAMGLRKGAMSIHEVKRYSEAEIAAKAEEFEAVFLSQMVKHMFAGIETSEEFGGGAGEEAFKGMMTEEYGKVLAKAGGIGLADHVKQQLLQLQEMA